MCFKTTERRVLWTFPVAPNRCFTDIKGVSPPEKWVLTPFNEAESEA